MAKFVVIPGEGSSVLVGTANPPTVEVGCQVIAPDYDPGATYQTSPVAAGFDGQMVYMGKTPTLALSWLNDAGETNSLSDFLEDNEGDTVYVKVTVGGAAVAYTYTCQAVPGGDLVGRAGQPVVSVARLPIFARAKVAT